MSFLHRRGRRSVLVAVGLVAAGAVLVVPFGTASEGGSPGGTAVADGHFVDQSSGGVFAFSLTAEESPPSMVSPPDEAGIGSINLRLTGSNTVPLPQRGRAVACTLSAGGTTPPFPPNQGSFPLTTAQCNVANNQSVRVDGCRVNVTAHVFSHTDHPLVPYFGSAVADVDLNATAGEHGRIEIKIHTPKSPITLAGDLEPGAIVISTCS